MSDATYPLPESFTEYLLPALDALSTGDTTRGRELLRAGVKRMKKEGRKEETLLLSEQLALIYRQQRKWLEVIKCYHDLLAVWPDLEIAQYWLALAYWAVGDLNHAIHHFELSRRAIRRLLRQPDLPNFLRNNPLRRFRNLEEVFRTYITSTLGVARAYMKQGQLKRARRMTKLAKLAARKFKMDLPIPVFNDISPFIWVKSRG